MRDNGRWQLTDVQRLFVVLAFVSAVFMCAMSWGSQSIVLFLVALLLVLGAGLAVFLLGLRFNGRIVIQGYGYVVMASPPPAGIIVGRCDLRLRVELPGRASTMVKLRDPAVPLVKWPQVGMVLPVELGGRNGRQLKVRWDSVDPNQARPAGTDDTMVTPPLPVPIYTDYVDDQFRQQVPTSPAGSINDAPSPSAYVDLDDYPSSPTQPTPATPFSPTAPAPRATTEGIIDAEILNPPEFDGEASANAAHFELPMRNIPQPRPAEPFPATVEPVVPAEPVELAAPVTTGPDADAQAMGIMLVVSDLVRSERFYRDKVGFSVVDSGANVVVLAYGEGRILLRQLADMSPVDRRVSHLHLRVPDVDSSYRDLKARGVEFVHRPRVTSRGDKLDLWAATFRDPDGHDIALTQWRAREDA